MRNNIPWKNDWAKYRAMDLDGRVFEFEKKPELYLDYGYWSAKGKFDEVSNFDHWHETLEKRK